MSSALPTRSVVVEGLFAGAVAAAELRGPGDPSRLFAAERARHEHWAAKRIDEFSAGRQCAHAALSQLGVEPVPLLPLPDRRPAWPEGVVGSISHCRGFSTAVVARATHWRAIGIDVERARAVEPHLWPRILTDAEQARVVAQPPELRLQWATLVFSAKEAFYKCQYAVRQQWVDFHDAEVEFSPPTAPGAVLQLRVVAPGIELAGRGVVRDEFVLTGFAWEQ